MVLFRVDHDLRWWDDACDLLTMCQWNECVSFNSTVFTFIFILMTPSCPRSLKVSVARSQSCTPRRSRSPTPNYLACNSATLPSLSAYTTASAFLSPPGFVENSVGAFGGNSVAGFVESSVVENSGGMSGFSRPVEHSTEDGLSPIILRTPTPSPTPTAAHEHDYVNVERRHSAISTDDFDVQW